ncbi:homoserine kinase [Evansella cellulosilytica]|uniref:Homoserine kinase n=1 Tax=Evansella cellulosilytica (strain ATCC 21833 / DSM 2522 / FERM P-1141 / JCM 9156 / N-4) TaxID=649639 RepID=E6TY81_EVAC2|nr:homoserine kinase [Evansella cellulosilytica]ADU32400.1 homoserine kinase [Evansella cellulosilytica DSM 2522]
MITTPMFTITVPASTANLGPGFDSVGLAIDRYLTLHISKSDEWTFVGHSPDLEGLPTGTDNYIYEIAAAVAEKYNQTLPPCLVDMYSSIPMSRGLGSSAAAIIAGIELADQLLGLSLTNKEKAHLSSSFEGHPDNVTASLYGGLVIGSHRGDDTDVILGGCPEIDIVAIIPSYELKTKESRGLLPSELSYRDAVKASSVSNVLVAALLQNEWNVVGKMMMNDLFHQPYRKNVVPELETALSIVSELDVYGTSLSGAGPIVLFFTKKGNGAKVKNELHRYYSEHNVQLLNVDKNGVTVTQYLASKRVSQ